jgi:hypothetical protein
LIRSSRFRILASFCTRKSACGASTSDIESVTNPFWLKKASSLLSRSRRSVASSDRVRGSASSGFGIDSSGRISSIELIRSGPTEPPQRLFIPLFHICSGSAPGEKEGACLINAAGKRSFSEHPSSIICASLAWMTRTLPENELFLTPTNSTRCELESTQIPSTVPTGSPHSSMTLHPVRLTRTRLVERVKQDCFHFRVHFRSSHERQPADLSRLAQPRFLSMNWISYMSSRVPEYNIYCYLVLIELVLAFYRFHRLFLPAKFTCCGQWNHLDRRAIVAYPSANDYVVFGLSNSVLLFSAKPLTAIRGKRF